VSWEQEGNARRLEAESGDLRNQKREMCAVYSFIVNKSKVDTVHYFEHCCAVCTVFEEAAESAEFSPAGGQTHLQ
jgi:hypothetical protein